MQEDRKATVAPADNKKFDMLVAEHGNAYHYQKGAAWASAPHPAAKLTQSFASTPGQFGT